MFPASLNTPNMQRPNGTRRDADMKCQGFLITGKFSTFSLDCKATTNCTNCCAWVILELWAHAVVLAEQTQECVASDFEHVAMVC
mmetsp:Transcript_7263/g.16580  ORF Transcript_7263/g.16580 Transcript_7263/m.16580 type:complete len:85 (-) Transcript_7263:634-888(-)